MPRGTRSGTGRSYRIAVGEYRLACSGPDLVGVAIGPVVRPVESTSADRPLGTRLPRERASAWEWVLPAKRILDPLACVSADSTAFSVTNIVRLVIRLEQLLLRALVGETGPTWVTRAAAAAQAGCRSCPRRTGGRPFGFSLRFARLGPTSLGMARTATYSPAAGLGPEVGSQPVGSNTGADEPSPARPTSQAPTAWASRANGAATLLADRVGITFRSACPRPRILPSARPQDRAVDPASAPRWRSDRREVWGEHAAATAPPSGAPVRTPGGMSTARHPTCQA
jgi:hypothetical protein